MTSPRRHAWERPDAPIRITTAGSSPQEDHRRRVRHYVVSMTIRSVCFVGAAIAGTAGINWLWPILIAAALILPYVAVVGANAQTTRHDDLPLTGGGRSDRQLGSRDG